MIKILYNFFSKINIYMKTRKNVKGVKKKYNKTIKKGPYSKDDFKSGDGMLTTVWGPSLWHTLHTISFNFPVKPTKKHKRDYKKFISTLRHILPCGHCRKNIVKNLKKVPLNAKALKNRDNFSHWMYDLHEQINKMLRKKSGLSYEEVRDRYEHFRSRCTKNPPKTKIIIMKKKKKTRKKNIEKGCTEPLFGKKAKCVIKIIPKDKKEETFQMDKQCIKRRNLG